MTHYDYKVVPAPRRAKKVRGVRSGDELFALTLTDAINEVARQGWEYVRVEHLPAEAPGGWFRSGAAGEQTVLVFRRDRESLGPRLATVRAEPDAMALAAEAAEASAAASVAAERAAVDRVQASLRHRESPFRIEPRLGEPTAETASPLRSVPKLGPAEKT